MNYKIKKILILFIFSLFLTSCSLPGLEGNTKNDVIIAGGNTTERQILSEIVSQIIKHDTKLKVGIINNLSSTTLIHTAMLKNEINVSSAMYSGTSITGELQLEPIIDSKKALLTVQKEYLKRYRRKWYPSYGFENTYAFMVTKDFAKKNKLKKVSDLEKLSKTIKVGVDSSWINRKGDGYKNFKKKYNFEFNKIYPMDIGLVYKAVASNKMDVVLGYSTDGRIDSYNLLLLDDDRSLFPAYDCSPVVSENLIKKHPELDNAINKICKKINLKEMQHMNRMSDEELIEPKNVAKWFLEKNNYFNEVKNDK